MIDYQGVLGDALRMACAAYGQDIKGVLHDPNNPKSPVLLSVKDEPIGIVHLVRLSGISTWDDSPYAELAKTADEVSQAILDRIALIKSAKERGFYISSSGNIFDLTKIQGRFTLQVNTDGTFSVNNQQVTYNNCPLKIASIQSEWIFQVSCTPDNCLKFSDLHDCRKGKGMYVNPETGEFFRK